ncbi:MAG: hypothetical protein H6832_13970 [Planctomycetes bacterium]|nr:hypothetical protein [Planctomycetota bacterium]MCB9919504.1 hypothetical protein [Planctomycetota bacterium]
MSVKPQRTALWTLGVAALLVAFASTYFLSSASNRTIEPGLAKADLDLDGPTTSTSSSRLPEPENDAGVAESVRNPASPQEQYAVRWRLRILDGSGRIAAGAEVRIASEEFVHEALERTAAKNPHAETLREPWRSLVWCETHGTLATADDTGIVEFTFDPRDSTLGCARSKDGGQTRAFVLDRETIGDAWASVQDDCKSGAVPIVERVVTLEPASDVTIHCMNSSGEDVPNCPVVAHALDAQMLAAYETSPKSTDSAIDRKKVGPCGTFVSGPDGRIRLLFARFLLEDLRVLELPREASRREELIDTKDVQKTEHRRLAALLCTPAVPAASPTHTLVRCHHGGGFLTDDVFLVVPETGSLDFRVVAADDSKLDFALEGNLNFESLSLGSLEVEREPLRALKPCGVDTVHFDHVGIGAQFEFYCYGTHVQCDAGGSFVGPSSPNASEERTVRMDRGYAFAKTRVRREDQESLPERIVFDIPEPPSPRPHSRMATIEDGFVYVARYLIDGSPRQQTIHAWIPASPAVSGLLEGVTLAKGTVREWPELVLSDSRDRVTARCVDEDDRPIANTYVRVVKQVAGKGYAAIPGLVGRSDAQGFVRFDLPRLPSDPSLALAARAGANHGSAVVPLRGPSPRVLTQLSKGQVVVTVRAPDLRSWVCACIFTPQVPDPFEQKHGLSIKTDSSGVTHYPISGFSQGTWTIEGRGIGVIGAIRTTVDIVPGEQIPVILDANTLHRYELQFVEARGASVETNVRVRSRDDTIADELAQAKLDQTGSKLVFHCTHDTLALDLLPKRWRAISRIWTPGIHRVLLEAPVSLPVEASSISGPLDVVVRAVSIEQYGTTVSRHVDNYTILKFANDGRRTGELQLTGTMPYEIEVRVGNTPFRTVLRVDPNGLRSKLVIDSPTSAHLVAR